eukprot:11581129-Ditylum_brightwellii.AAC.1
MLLYPSIITGNYCYSLISKTTSTNFYSPDAFMMNCTLLQCIPNLFKANALSVTRLVLHDTVTSQHMLPPTIQSIDGIGKALGCGYSYVGMQASKFLGHQENGWCQQLGKNQHRKLG